MCGIRIFAAALLLVSCHVASNGAEHSWIVESDLPAEEVVPQTPQASHELLLKMLSKKSAHELVFELRNEFYTMGVGKDFYGLVADKNENREYHAVAEAMLQLWRRLPHMEVASVVLRTALANGAHAAHAHADVAKAFPVIKEHIEKLLQEQPASYDEYKRLKSEALAKQQAAAAAAADYQVYYFAIPKTKEEAKKIVAESFNEPALKRLMVHATFGNETRKQSAWSPQTYQLAKSILELSKDAEYGAKAQALYDEAVEETAKGVEDVTAANVNDKHVKETFIQIAIQFFKTLASKFENDPTLKAKFAETKELVSKSR